MPKPWNQEERGVDEYRYITTIIVLRIIEFLEFIKIKIYFTQASKQNIKIYNVFFQDSN